MALIKCLECGHEVSDKASACPNCGCPIEKGLICNECGASLSSEDTICSNCGCPVGKEFECNDCDRNLNPGFSTIYEEKHIGKDKKGSNSLLWVLIVLLIGLIGGGVFYYFMNDINYQNDSDPDGSTEEFSSIGLNEEVKRTIEGNYAIVLYNDNVGEIYNPNGGRMCSFRLTDGRQEPLTLKLSQSLYIMGTAADRLYLTRMRLFMDYSDYLKYNSKYNPDKSLGVAVEQKETDNGTCFIVTISPSMIEQKEIPIHHFKVSEDIDYTMIYYNDEYGTLFNDKGERICGVSKEYTSLGDLSVKLSKSISMYGVTTSELSIKGDNLYTSTDDLIDDKYKRENEPSKRKAFVNRIEDKDATIFAFSKASEQNNTDKSSSNQRSTSSEWTISSVEELQKKIVGTIWTCRPMGRTWYRLVFTEKNMILYYAQPSDGMWMGGEQGKWFWNATQSYDSDTGEKCYTIQFKKQDSDFSYGALLFFKDGEIQFNWLRGREGGDAECKDFNWE